MFVAFAGAQAWVLGLSWAAEPERPLQFAAAPLLTVNTTAEVRPQGAEDGWEEILDLEEGRWVDFRLRVENTGDEPLTGLRIRATLSDSLSGDREPTMVLSTAKDSPKDVKRDQFLAIDGWPMPTVPAKGSVTVILSAELDPPGFGEDSECEPQLHHFRAAVGPPADPRQITAAEQVAVGTVRALCQS
ncbi:MAG: hypothetical protein LBC97_01920 [Bifidobacteriaceae bacterium]|nr:hypothetical protein [Bifidobacteriaceae bacterium]